jgi:hypothetical protein
MEREKTAQYLRNLGSDSAPFGNTRLGNNLLFCGGRLFQLTHTTAAIIVELITVVTLLAVHVHVAIATHHLRAIVVAARRLTHRIAGLASRTIRVAITARGEGAVRVTAGRIDASSITLLNCQSVKEAIAAHSHRAVDITGGGVVPTIIALLCASHNRISAARNADTRLASAVVTILNITAARATVTTLIITIITRLASWTIDMAIAADWNDTLITITATYIDAKAVARLAGCSIDIPISALSICTVGIALRGIEHVGVTIFAFINCAVPTHQATTAAI